MWKRLFRGLYVALILAPVQANAWSLETHLFVGAAVLEDLLTDDMVNLCASGVAASPAVDCSKRYPVRAEVVSAIRANPQAFLAGTLGPDVYPDFITGQVTVHPGIEGGWLTDRWLAHLLRNSTDGQHVAFAYGFMSHAAADIFAHTYVNAYAGDIFDIGKHMKGHEVELRHFTLERFIADRTPTTWKNYAGSSLLDAPKEFLADKLILDGGVATQYKKVMIPAHLVGVESLYTTVRRLRDESQRLTAAILKEVGLAYLPVEAAEEKLKQLEKSLELTRSALQVAQSTLDNIDKLLSGLEDELLKAGKAIDDNILKISSFRAQIEATKVALQAKEASLGGLRHAVEQARHVVEEARKILNSTPTSILGEICEDWPWPVNELCKLGDIANPAHAAAKASLDAAIAVLKVHEDALGAAERFINDAQAALVQFDQNIKDVEKAIADLKLVQQTLGVQIALQREQRKIDAAAVAAAQKAVDEALKLVQQARAVLAKAKQDFQPVADFAAKYAWWNLYLSNWVEDIRLAMVDYIKTSQEIGRRIALKESGSRLGLYKEWFECWAPVFASIPSEVPQTICVARASYQQAKDKLEEELNRIVNDLGVLGWLLAPNVKLQQEFDKHVRKPFEVEVRKVIRQTSLDAVAFLSNRELASLLDLMDSANPVSAGYLNSVFESDSSSGRLLPIGDVANRIMADAGLTHEQGVIDPTKFSALFNSIVLSKLALLDKQVLNRVYTDMTGQTASPFGDGLYQEPSPRFFSLLEDAVHSIDGNHQWQVVALPYARETGKDEGWPAKRRYGAPHPAAHSGFRPWGYRLARERMFLKLFSGPLNPNLELHPVVLATYAYPACTKNPFPSTTDDQGGQIPEDLRCRFFAKSDASGLPGDYSALSTERVAQAEMAALTRWQLRIARNEVFARHGLKFGPTELQAHFMAQAWYKPTDESLTRINSRLSVVEWRNIEALKRIERRLNAHSGLPTEGP